jgi:glycosyltransferase involved in cell wall biosynthesis
MAFEHLKNKSIGIIIPDFDFGGEEKRALFFINNYAEHFKEVFLFAPKGASSEFVSSKVKYVEMTIRGYTNILKLLRYVKINNIHFIQGHKRSTLPYLFVIEKFTSAKVNFNFDSFYTDKAWLYSLTPYRLYYLSDQMKRFYERWTKQKDNVTINMGGEFYSPLTGCEAKTLIEEIGVTNKFILLSLGRLSEVKNHEMTLYALSKIADYNVICLFVGSGPRYEALKELSNKLYLHEKVKFLGHQTDVAKFLSVSHVLIQSSIQEGFPNVFIEAASLAKPIITTKVGSYSTLVNDNGLAVDVNDIQGMANAILELKANYSRYAENARRLGSSSYFKQFHKSKMLENYLIQYDKDAQNGGAQ